MAKANRMASKKPHSKCSAQRAFVCQAATLFDTPTLCFRSIEMYSISRFSMVGNFTTPPSRPTNVLMFPSSAIPDVLLNGITVASPPRPEARGVRWPGAQLGHGKRQDPAARLHPEEHGQCPTASTCCPFVSYGLCAEESKRSRQ